MRIRLLTGLLAVVVAVAVAGGGVAGAGTVRHGDAALDVATCPEQRARVAQVPLLRERIRVMVEDLEGEIAEARPASRRSRLAVRLGPRIEALRGLDARLVREASAVGARCAGPA